MDKRELNDGLMVEIVHQRINGVKDFIAQGADVNYVFKEDYDFDGQRLTRETSVLEKVIGKALDYCEESEFRVYTDIIKVLIKNGVDLDKRRVLIEVCNEYSHYDKACKIAELLIDNGAGINVQDPVHGDTPLLSAVSRKNYELVQYLIGKGADVNAKTDSGITVLIKLCRDTGANDPEMISLIKQIIDQGADVNAAVKSGVDGFRVNDTALIVAVRGYSLDLMQLLIEKGADVNANIEKGLYGSPLGAALSRETRSNNEQKFKILLQNGAKVEGKAGGEALISAANEGYLEIVKSLIEKGVDANFAESSGKTALDYAKERGHSAIEEYLKNSAAEVQNEKRPDDAGSDYQEIIKKWGAIRRKLDDENEDEYGIRQEYTFPKVDAEFIPAVIQGLEAFDKDLAVECAVLINRIGPAAKDTVKALIKVLKEHRDEIGFYIDEFFAALGRIGPDAAEALPVLLELLDGYYKNDGLSNTAGYLLKSLGRIDCYGKNEEVFKALLNAIQVGCQVEKQHNKDANAGIKNKFFAESAFVALARMGENIKDRLPMVESVWEKMQDNWCNNSLIDRKNFNAHPLYPDAPQAISVIRGTISLDDFLRE